MGFVSKLRAALLDKRLENIDIDSPQLLDVHQEILKTKKLMRAVFEEFYDICMSLDSRYLTGQGKCIELGAGVSFLKERYAYVLTTDIKPSPYLDGILDAQNMCLPKESVRTFYGINCFHHLPEPRKFFRELDRTLALGGGAILIEPYYGLFATLVFKRIHKQEHFNKEQVAWESEQDPRQYMSSANQALSYLIFVRDRKRFEAEFPTLEIVHMETMSNYLRYLLSGGVNFKQLIPDATVGIAARIEKLLKPFESMMALHHVVIIRKVRSSQ